MHAMVTLVNPAETERERWSAAERDGRCLVINDVELLESMLRSPVMQSTREIVRVVIDGGCDLDRYLFLVATLPDSFHGEMLFVRRDGSGHLSTRELITKRTVKTISEVEVEVYLRWHGLPARSRNSYPPETSAPQDGARR